MKRINIMSILFFLTLLPLAFQPNASASAMYRTTRVTFSAPVEIPGKVLPAGTYIFRLLYPTTDQNIVQVYNKNRTQLLATMITIPDYLPRVPNTTIVKFGENPAVSPPPIKEWFYPGDKTGREFVYPRKRAAEIAKAYNENVLGTTETSKNPGTLVKGHVTAVTPQGNDADYHSMVHPKH